MQALKLFIRIVDKISCWIGTAVSVLLPAMTLVLAFEVVARYVFKRPTIWAFDMSIFMFGYCGLLAGAYVLRNKEHINVDLLYGRFSPRGKAIMDVLTGLLFYFFIILVIIYGWKAAHSALLFGDRRPTEWGPPLGHFKLMIPVGALLLLLQGLANWIRNLYLAITGKELDA
jgi:TRAP-type mannitol/chloroaromatic compound transport system permease small subunit